VHVLGGPHQGPELFAGLSTCPVGGVQRGPLLNPGAVPGSTCRNIVGTAVVYQGVVYHLVSLPRPDPAIHINTAMLYQGPHKVRLSQVRVFRFLAECRFPI
jgi:hypothetical protein